jgi:hypothetical protein
LALVAAGLMFRRPQAPIAVAAPPPVAPAAEAKPIAPPPAANPPPVPEQTRTALPPLRHVRATPRAEVGYVTVNAVPWGAVYLDGNRVGDETPIYRLAVPPGKHRLTIVNRNRSSPARDVVVEPGKVQTVSVKW